MQTEKVVSEMSVLICYDGSSSAQRSLTVAAAVLNGETAVLLHVWNPPERVLADAFGLKDDDAGPNYAQLETLIRERAGEVLGDGEDLASRLGVAVDARQERNRGSVWQTILDVADEVDATLIVTGTHGATAVQSGLLGSVSNALVHHSHRPVLVVPDADGTAA